MGNLDGRIALVTGGSRGIGAEICRQLAASGAQVGVNCHANPAKAEEVVAEILAASGEAFVVPGDVSDPDQAEAMVKAVVDKYRVEGDRRGTLHILVNNAGITRDGVLMRMSEADWDAVLQVNLRGAFLVTKAAARYMLQSGNGRIINVASVGAVMGIGGQANYGAAKGGLIGLTLSNAAEFASRGVTCNVITPGFIQTDITSVLSEARKAEVLVQIPLGRFGEVGDVAPTVVFLASDAASYITGAIIPINGGMRLG